MPDTFTGLYVIGALTLLGLLVLIALHGYRRERGPDGPPLRTARDDLTHMMILLQTMRDLLDQQKALARQLNTSLDRKVTFIKQSVDAALEDVAALRESARGLARMLDDAKAEFDRQRGAAGGARDDDGAEPGVLRFDRYADRVREAGPEPGVEPPVLQVLAVPQQPSGSEDVIDSWVGLDFAGDEPDPLAFEVPETPPERPGDAQAARDAFRALLDMEAQETAPPAASEPHRRQGAEGDGGNGKGGAPLQKRVYEYNDAGMTVSQIAQELGIGKGEVRLILGLRKDRSR